jgi:hypothetical protein
MILFYFQSNICFWHELKSSETNSIDCAVNCKISHYNSFAKFIDKIKIYLNSEKNMGHLLQIPKYVVHFWQRHM